MSPVICVCTASVRLNIKSCDIMALQPYNGGPGVMNNDPTLPLSTLLPMGWQAVLWPWEGRMLSLLAKERSLQGPCRRQKQPPCLLGWSTFCEQWCVSFKVSVSVILNKFWSLRPRAR